MNDSRTAEQATLREVIRLGHPVLRATAEAVPEEWLDSGRLQALCRDMSATMLEEDGVGLAAPQIAESLRLFTYWVPGSGDEPEITPRALVNPEIKAVGEELEEGWEGCLSIPGLRGVVPRYRRIKVRALSPQGETLSFTADGFHARVIQHELDHLDGVVFLDRMLSSRSLAFEEEWERYVLGLGEDDD